MQEDIDRLYRHLKQPEFHFQELRFSEEAENACLRWSLLQSIRAAVAPERQELEPAH
ncbi:hypothetical protein QU481_00065 [Crenobacter sp. SG2303]|uniref:Uncharacterized protein n=1 Tax=Crenobacter oryzisoli TaxID=3056844 RepID=A0ABT7XHM1_9NEIS|nr:MULTISPECIES: BcsR/BcsP family cellulose biosynthesis protein [unclassified Crenobacter]MDN0073294.1 hypothetical protein [Crenobacter sp. SG2303]MDN0084375.1 hypothetical protein [Crenobacter sp. SG2305]